MTSKRIQLSRRKGYRKPEGAIVVARPTRWGNPVRVVPVHASGPFDLERDGVGFIGQHTDIESARASAAHRFRDLIRLGLAPSPDEIRRELAGHDLACWCPLDQPCHADVLLEIANGPQSEPEQCSYVTFRGSRNPDSPGFGPNERCENDALPDSEYCAWHVGGDDQ